MLAVCVVGRDPHEDASRMKSSGAARTQARLRSSGACDLAEVRVGCLELVPHVDEDLGEMQNGMRCGESRVDRRSCLGVDRGSSVDRSVQRLDGLVSMRLGMAHGWSTLRRA